MAISASLKAFVIDHFAALGPVSVRAMFGGGGIYADGVMFGLIDDERIFLKADDALRAELAAQGAVPWIYTKTKGPQSGVPLETSYSSLPEAAWDDPDEACAWARRSIAVVQAIRAAKPGR